MISRDEIIKGIKECDLNGGMIGNCPYKEILTLLKEKEIEIEHLKLIIKKADIVIESIKEKLNELLYEDFPDVENVYKKRGKDKLSSMYGTREE